MGARGGVRGGGRSDASRVLAVYRTAARASVVFASSSFSDVPLDLVVRSFDLAVHLLVGDRQCARVLRCAQRLRPGFACEGRRPRFVFLACRLCQSANASVLDGSRSAHRLPVSVVVVNLAYALTIKPPL